MDLVQSKLTRSEWNSIEVSVSQKELRIIKMIIKGHSNPEIIENDNTSLSSYLKIKPDSESIEYYLYQTYFEKDIQQIINKYSIKYDSPHLTKKMVRINTPDLIRLKQNTYEAVVPHHNNIIEYIYIKTIEKFYKHFQNQEKTRWMLYYYTIYHIRKSTTKLNSFVSNFIDFVIESNRYIVSIPQLIQKFNNYIEKNEMIYKHSDRTLYSHQKDIFKVFNRTDIYHTGEENPNLVLYIAPTSTGKTLTPIGLSEKYRVIFVCAARHVGINLAKAAISSGKKVAFWIRMKLRTSKRWLA